MNRTSHHPELGSLEARHPTGSRRRETGEPGDDLMFGACRIHSLDDALRRWFDAHPDEPIEGRDGQPHRRDALWITRNLEVMHRPDHDYEGAVSAGSDHALVVTELTRTMSR
jgi:hypothetical protein